MLSSDCPGRGPSRLHHDSSPKAELSKQPHKSMQARTDIADAHYLQALTDIVDSFYTKQPLRFTADCYSCTISAHESEGALATLAQISKLLTTENQECRKSAQHTKES